MISGLTVAEQAALDAGDYDTLQRIADDLDGHPKPRPLLHQSALWYAEQGQPVFPLAPGTKIPFKGSRGCLDATTDANQINAWWLATPDANIGLATGHLVDVVDIDGTNGQRSRLAHWCSQCKDDTAICDHAGPGTWFVTIERAHIGKVRTPRGMHIYVAAQGDGNKADVFGSRSGVDYRGVGGYVVAPPSRTPDGEYAWTVPIDFDRTGRP